MNKEINKSNKIVRVLAVDDNESLIGMLEEYFKDHEKIKIVTHAYNGLDAIKVIEENKDNFDVLLLDLIMPKKDGIYVLEQLKKKKIDKPVIVGTSFNADETIARVSKFNPKHFILKPFDMFDLENKILDAVSFKLDKASKVNVYHNNLEISVTKLLHGLGVPSHIKGYQYIREGVILMYEKPDIVGAITKELYPETSNPINIHMYTFEKNLDIPFPLSITIKYLHIFIVYHLFIKKLLKKQKSY